MSLIISLRSRSATGLAVVVLAIGLLASAGYAITVGSADLSARTVGQIVLDEIGIGRFDIPVLTQHIVWQLRAPRVVAAALVGAGLALGGAVIQSLTRNALADPYLLGVSSGSALGAVVVIVFGSAIIPLGAGLSLTAAMTVGAFAGGLGALILVLGLSSGRGGALLTNRLILAGVAIGQLSAAAASAVVLFLGGSEAPRRVLQWTLGSVAGARWNGVAVTAVLVIISLVVTLGYARTLDAFAFGERSAASLGITVNRTRWVLYGLVSLLTAALVSVAGVVGFVGLIVPHGVRLVFGPLHRRLLCLSALVGAVFLIWADVLGRVLLADTEVPLGIVTAIIGVPLFVILLRRRPVRL